MSDRFLDLNGLDPEDQETLQMAVDCAKSGRTIHIFDEETLTNKNRKYVEKGESNGYILGGLALIATGVILNHKKEITACFSKVGRILFGKK